MSKFRILIKSYLFALLLLFCNSSLAALPDSLDKDYSHFLEILNSDLTNKEVSDSVWDYMTWDWLEVDQVKFDEAIELLESRARNSAGAEEKAVMYNLLQQVYKARKLLGKAVVMYGKLIAVHTVLEDSMAVLGDYHWLAWMYHDNKLFTESLIAHRKVIEILKPMKMIEELAEKKWTHGYFYSVAGWELNKTEYQDSAIKYLGEAFYFRYDAGQEVHLEWTITYAMALARKGQRREAIKIAKYGIQVAENNNEPLYLARLNKQLSQYYMALEMEDSSYYHIYESAKYEDQLYAADDPNVLRLNESKGRMHAYNLGSLIAIHNAFDHTERSVALFERIFEGPEKLADNYAIKFYRGLAASTYSQSGDFEQSAINYSMSLTFSDSLHRVDLDNASEVKAAQLKSQISIEKERAALEQKQYDIQIENEKGILRIIVYSAVVVAFVTIIFLFVVYRRFKITSRQNKLTAQQKQMVESAFTELDLKSKEILASINYAKRIQSALLPSKKDIKSYIPTSFILYMPKDIVAGDFYWLEKVGNKTLFAAADCTGHGVPGAMVSVICNNGLNRSVREQGITEPGKILDATRKIVIAEFEKSEEEVNDGMDIALCSLEPNPSKRSLNLQFAGANNPLWVIRKDTNVVEEYKANRQPVGKYVKSNNYKTHSLEVYQGDQFYLFSDGFTDQFGGVRRKKYLRANFEKFLLQIKDLPLGEQKQSLVDEHNRWRGDEEQIDDICIIGYKVP
jgi:serine phosphatase RsbU (regulator of sigma subunit)